MGFALCLQAQSPHGENLKINCAACHNADSWDIPFDSWNFKEPSNPEVSKTTGWKKSGGFNHYSTNFPLLGQHASVDCKNCHDNLVFENASTECMSCHTDIHQQTVGSDCTRCHTMDNWLVDNITELHQDNGFPLLGIHAEVSCDACHQSETMLRFDRIGNDCLNCHLKDYNATTDPNHLDAGFSVDCNICHNINAFDWSSENIIHDFFPLTKGHKISNCSVCHTNGSFSNTPSDCFVCHEANYNNAQNPNHVSSNFPTNCADCHTTEIGWRPAEFANHDNFYVLKDSHADIANNCTACHTDGFSNTPNTCFGCHADNYNATSNPNHISAGFPTDCESCHTEKAWQPADFDHKQYFPIFSGKHKNEWNDCVECHTTQGNFAVFSCIDCHQHNNANSLAGEHDEVSGYSFSSPACYNCHPNGDN